jgi:hypothetical protein
VIDDRDELIAAIDGLRGADPGEVDQQTLALIERSKQGRAGLEDLFQWTVQRIEAALGQGADVESTPMVGSGTDPATADPHRLLRRAERIRWTIEALDRNANAKLAIRDLLLDLENG